MNQAIKIIEVFDRMAFSTSRAARYIGCCANSLRKKANLGLIPCRRDEAGHRVFLKKDLDDYLENLPVYDRSDIPFRGRLVKDRTREGGDA